MGPHEAGVEGQIDPLVERSLRSKGGGEVPPMVLRMPHQMGPAHGRVQPADALRLPARTDLDKTAPRQLPAIAGQEGFDPRGHRQVTVRLHAQVLGDAVGRELDFPVGEIEIGPGDRHHPALIVAAVQKIGVADASGGKRHVTARGVGQILVVVRTLARRLGQHADRCHGQQFLVWRVDLNRFEEFTVRGVKLINLAHRECRRMVQTIDDHVRGWPVESAVDADHLVVEFGTWQTVEQDVAVDAAGLRSLPEGRKAE
ncbi:MAG: hypothetical protein CMJ59_12575 [Planctomycetaceae bacterium]|nr:hypothetical protein [Planctomycetaceae bacterium]